MLGMKLLSNILLGASVVSGHSWAQSTVWSSPWWSYLCCCLGNQPSFYKFNWPCR